MEMNRALQNEILTFILARNPRRLGTKDLQQLLAMTETEESLAANLLYFEGHGLIEPKSVTIGADNYFVFNSGLIRLTVKGIDFLAADGGLGAILNAVTVKFHDDSLARISDFLQQSPMPQEAKRRFLDRLKLLPADAIKHVVLKLMDLGLENSQKALQLLQTALG